MEKVRSGKLLILSLLSTLLVTGCSLSAGESISSDVGSQKIYGMVVPHHLLVRNEIEAFYKKVSEGVGRDIKRVILVSPNHFGTGSKFMETNSEIDEADKDFVQYLSQDSALSDQPNAFGIEHGIYVHQPFIRKYFPQAKLVPIILKRGAKEEGLLQLVDLVKKEDMENSLIIASIDFSHYVPEVLAAENDSRTVGWLEDWSENDEIARLSEFEELAQTDYPENPDAVAIDSPETLFFIVKVMEKIGAKNFEFWKRTSVLSMMKGPADSNTSHLFLEFGG